jgi:lipoprotein-anchoring transpeptidase ErfK/SrfK
MLGGLFCSSLYANTFVFNPKNHSWKAIDNNGSVVRTGRASGGKGYCSDIHRSCRTPVGSYTVWSKGSSSCKSSRYPLPNGGAPMPYCMFFSKYYAIHGSDDVPNYNASHGCIRVTRGDAAWLSHNFVHVGTQVIVKPY